MKVNLNDDKEHKIEGRLTSSTLPKPPTPSVVILFNCRSCNETNSFSCAVLVGEGGSGTTLKIRAGKRHLPHNNELTQAVTRMSLSRHYTKFTTLSASCMQSKILNFHKHDFISAPSITFCWPLHILMRVHLSWLSKANATKHLKDETKMACFFPIIT